MRLPAHPEQMKRRRSGDLYGRQGREGRTTLRLQDHFFHRRSDVGAKGNLTPDGAQRRSLRSPPSSRRPQPLSACGEGRAVAEERPQCAILHPKGEWIVSTTA